VKNQHNFPIIFQMWRDYAAIPATSAPSERVFSTAGNLITKKRTRMASETIRYVICLRAWGLLAKDDEEEEIQVIDLTDQIGSINDIVERVVHLHLSTLAERRIEEGLQKEEKEKTEALRLVAGSILKDDWEEANKRRLVRRATALIDAQKQLMEEVVREYTETL
jgi:Na+/phosphate symporter